MPEALPACTKDVVKMPEIDYLTILRIDDNLKVTVRERKTKKGISLHLHSYFEGVRSTKSMKIYLKPEPKHGKLKPDEQKLNKKKREEAEKYRQKYYLECKNEILRKLSGEPAYDNFFDYFIKQSKTKNSNTQKQWEACLRQLMLYHQSAELHLEQVNEDWVQGFRTFLIEEARKKNGEFLKQNTQAIYFRKLRQCISSAFHRGLLKTNPGDLVTKIKEIKPEVEFLTQEEVDALEMTDCEYPALKTAFLFSVATGMRWSDIVKLTWGNIRYSEKEGYFIRFRHQKTSTNNTLYIKDNAVELIGERQSDDKLIIPGLTYSDANNKKLRRWIKDAGINRHITFHCARHTNATLYRANGGDIGDLRERLGHSNINTTSQYDHSINIRKRNAKEFLPDIQTKKEELKASAFQEAQDRSAIMKVVKNDVQQNAYKKQESNRFSANSSMSKDRNSSAST
jgi:integrase